MNSISQHDNESELPFRIISKFSIKSLTIWEFGENDSSRTDSSIYRVYKFDKMGNLLLYRGGRKPSEYTWIKNHYDSIGHLQLKYFVDADGYISNVEEFMYEGNLIKESRKYGVQYHELHLREFERIRNIMFNVDKKIYNSKGQLICNSYCAVFPVVKDSLIEKGDNIKGDFWLGLIPRKNLTPKPIDCAWIINYTLDKSGNVIRERSSLGSTFFIDDSFAYDKKNNMTYKITFNSGDVTEFDSRKKVNGENRETIFENTYDKKGQLIEVRTFFDRSKICFMRTSFEYDNAGILRKKQVFKTYPSGCSCGASISGGVIYELSTAREVIYSTDTIVSDTLYVYEYNEFGEETNNSEYCGVAQLDKEGTLFHKDFRKTNELGLNTYTLKFYGKSQFFGTEEDEANFEEFYSHYDNGLIKEIKNREGKLYFYEYDFY